VLLASLFALEPGARAQDAGGAQDVAGAQGGAGAPAATAPVPGAAAPADPRARAARRLLRLSGGTVLRGLSRHAGERWELQRGKLWESLPDGAVESEQLESTALAEAGRRRGALRHGDSAGLASHVAWLVQAGLYAEGLNLASDLLTEDPEQPAVLALLRSGVVPAALPSLAVADAERSPARARLLAFAVAAPRSLQELAVEALREPFAAEPERTTLRAELDALLADRAAPARAFAALALRRLLPADDLSQPEVEAFLARALQDVSPDVRVQASRALSGLREQGIVLPVVQALELDSPAVRIHAAESLGTIGDAAAVPALVERLVTLPLDGSSGGFRAPHGNIFVGRQIAYVAGFRARVAQNAAAADPEIGVLQEGASLDVGVAGSGGDGIYLAESKALRTALTRLTGANPGQTKSAWKSWWSQNQSRWPGALTNPGRSSPFPPSTGAPR